jgi:D-3-phosphoglycerate dehydrogenase
VKRKILVATRTFGKYAVDPVNYLEKHDFELIFISNSEELKNFIGIVDAIIVGGMKITSEILRNAQNLKIIVKHGVGYDNIDVKTASKMGIPVIVNKGVNAHSVAELVIAFLFLLSRKIIDAHNELYSNRKWKDWVGFELIGKTLGIVGFGAIGKKVAEKAHALGLKILVNDPYVENFPKWISAVSLYDLLRESDFVTLHVPLMESTKKLISSNELRLMKNNAFLINTSRGEVVDEEALVDAINNGEIAGAALDVFENEPPYKSPVFLCKNIITTPHIGSHTYEALYKMGMKISKAIVDFFEGKVPEGIINPESLRGE